MPNDQLVGRVLAQDIETSDGLLPAGTPISRDLARVIYEAKLGTVQDMLETFSESKLDDPIELARRLGLDELAELFTQRAARSRTRSCRSRPSTTCGRRRSSCAAWRRTATPSTDSATVA